jgi:protein-S-isoprenylcysteine O-methyltransferase Ste14
MQVSTKVKTFIQLVVVCFGITFTFLRLRPAILTLSNIVGLVLMVFGFVLWVTARLQLGDSFSVSAQARRLVTHGLYSRIRNPVYVFGAVALSGLVLAMGKPIFLLALLLLVPLQIKRARAESKVLEEKFGDAYREYCNNTWF